MFPLFFSKQGVNTPLSMILGKSNNKMWCLEYCKEGKCGKVHNSPIIMFNSHL
jgi:hypothetical protein